MLAFVPPVAGQSLFGQDDLLEAALQGSYEDAKLALLRGSSVNVRDVDGNTALFHAAGAGAVTVVEVLLRHGARLDLSDQNGNTR